ncbi:MAG: hypothetical protein HQ472_08155, partial [Ignavibacteria bacterium]|nr:hypothetical protein [Ignavibacteria bacterium]
MNNLANMFVIESHRESSRVISRSLWITFGFIIWTSTVWINEANAQPWRAEPSMQTGQLPTAPLNTENVRVWQRVAEADDGSAEQKIPQYHRAGQQWGLYAARIPMAWEITMGSSDVRVLLQDQWWGPSSNGTIIPYGITTGIGLNPSNGETGSGRGDLVMKIRQKQSDGSFAILDDALQNSGPNGNILVFEKFDASTQTWVQELGAATGTEYSLRLSNYGHGVQCLSIMASALNAKGMIGVAPGCSYMLGDGDLKAPLLYDFDPTVIGMQTAHVVSSQTSLDWGHQLKQSSYIAVGAGNLIGASHFQYYDGLSNETIYKGCIPVEKRVDVGAWLDTRSIKAGVWNDGILIRDNSNVGITKECTTFDRRRIDLAKTNLSSPYYYWHQQKYPPATLETPSNIQYKTSGTCGTNGDIADGCYRMLGLPLGFPGTEHVDVFKYVDVVVPSSILCEGSGELYKQHETAQSYVIPFLNGIIALMRSVDITGGVNVTSELYPYTYGTACNEEFMAARPIYTNSKLQTTNKTVTRCELHRRGRDIITFTARKVPNKDYKYTVQEGDPMRRSWVYNNGYGLVDAYRCVANSIPAKGKNIYGNNDQLDFANGTEIGGKKYLHLGAWGRFDNAYDNNSLLFDTPAYGFVPEGFGAEVSCGKTVIGSSVYTVGTGNVACIDGIVESYTGGSIKTVANTNGRILFSGYFKSTGVIEGNLSLGDVVIRTGKIKLVPSTGMECRICT